MGKETGYFGLPKTALRAAAVPVENILRIKEAQLEITDSHDWARAGGGRFLTSGEIIGLTGILETRIFLELKILD